MNEFGTVYMSTVGCGIVYGKIASDEPVEPTTSATTANKDIVYGDADCDGDVDIDDVVAIVCYVADINENAISEQGLVNADVYDVGGGVNALDALSVQKYLVKVIDSLPEE
jgi:hypothetical protein